MIPREKVTLDEIVDSVSELDFRKREMTECGWYCPDISTVYYCPRQIGTKKEFLVTVIHELIHHTRDDFSTDKKENEDYVDTLAYQTYQNQEIKDFLSRYFKWEINKYFK